MICHDLYIALGADPTSLTNPLQSITSRSCGPNFVAHSERLRVEELPGSIYNRCDFAI